MKLWKVEDKYFGAHLNCIEIGGCYEVGLEEKIAERNLNTVFFPLAFKLATLKICDNGYRKKKSF